MAGQFQEDGQDWQPPLAGSALALAAALFLGTILWLRFGDAVYVERILGAIAGCF